MLQAPNNLIQRLELRYKGGNDRINSQTNAVCKNTGTT